MPAPATIDDLLSLIRGSGLVEPAHLDAHLDALRGEGALPDAPPALADRLVNDGLLTAFQTRQLLKGKRRGFFLGKYKILQPLGKGGMGQVFLAEQAPLGRHVALKVLSTEHLDKPVVIARFHREAHALASLDHRNIVRAYDIEQQGPWLFIVLEYVDGASLHDLVSTRGPLDVPRAIDVIRQSALGLYHAHEAGWVHRDIKPSNLLLSLSGVVKLLDLGLARLYEDETERLTRSRGCVLGTLDYLAPEQSRDSHAVDGRADIYGLGATFYYLLSGRAPFPHGTTVQKVVAHRTANPPPLRVYRRDVPAGVEAVLERMMAKQPKHRYATGAEVAAALNHWAVPQGPIPLDWLPPRLAALPPGTGRPRDLVPPAIPTSLSASPTAPMLTVAPLPRPPRPIPVPAPEPPARPKRRSFPLWLLLLPLLGALLLALWLLS